MNVEERGEVLVNRIDVFSWPSLWYLMEERMKSEQTEQWDFIMDGRELR